MKKVYFILPVIVSALGGCSQSVRTDDSALLSASNRDYVQQRKPVKCVGKSTYSDSTVNRNVTSSDNENCGTFHRLEFKRQSKHINQSFFNPIPDSKTH